MTIQNFEDLIIWQEARQLNYDVYSVFRQNRDYSFRDQIQRAVVSIMNNIAEGFERNKISKDNKQFISFLNISAGSCSEVKSMLYLAQDLDYITLDKAMDLRTKCTSISAKISGLIQTLQSNNGQNNRTEKLTISQFNNLTI